MCRAADKGEMRVGLGEIAEEGTTGWLDLFGKEADVVRISQEPLEQRFCFACSAKVKIGVYEPKTAHQERAILSSHTVVSAIAIDKITGL